MANSLCFPSVFRRPPGSIELASETSTQVAHAPAPGSVVVSEIEQFTVHGERSRRAEDDFVNGGPMAQSSGEQVQVQIKADEKELVGQFSNLVMFHHTAEEFTVHFIYVFPNVPQGKLVSSVIVSPGHAKRILRALEENIRRYEKQFGPIREVPEPTPIPNVGFVQ